MIDFMSMSMCGSVDYCKGYNAAVKTINEKYGWVSVEERLPELNTPVIGWYKDNPFSKYCPEIVSWNGKGWLFVYAERYVTTVTHWMPLPEPPKEE